MSVELWVDLLLVVLLSATIGYCFNLNRKLAGLRDSRAEMEKLVAEFGRATDKARAGLAELRSAGEAAGAALQEQSHKARTLADELAFLTQAGDRMAQRMASRSGEPEKPRVVARREPRSEAERDLLQALRQAR